jgi:hypothetical protein
MCANATAAHGWVRKIMLQCIKEQLMLSRSEETSGIHRRVS